MVEYVEPVLNKEEEQRYWFRKYFCPHCKKTTKFMRCDNCGKFFCTEHCEWDNESSWEAPNQPDYPICYKCS